MKQIKDTNVVKTPEVVLHPTFFFPPGVVDISSGTSESTDEDDVTYDDSASVDVVTDSAEDSTETTIIDDDGSAEQLPTPQWMTIISQEVRISSDGKAVIDVVIELEDVTGATEYDVRVTK
jgi:hypothetical protein